MTVPAEPVVISSETVVLRPFRDDDLADLLSAFADEAIALWNPGPTDPAAGSDMIRKRNDWSIGDHASWAIGAPEGRLIGGISLHHLNLDNRDGEIGYWVAPWARRRGVGRAALSLLVDFAFAELRLHRIYLYHAVENTVSCRLASSAGFRQEGELRSSYRCGDGRYHDEHLHGRLEDE